MQIGRGTPARQRFGKGASYARHRIARLMHELQPEVADAGVAATVPDARRPPAPPRRTRCCGSPRRPSPDGPGRWNRAVPRDALARTAAIAIAGAGGKEAAEDAVLGVEHGQVLIDDGLDLIRARAASQFRDLGGVQIVRRRQSRQAAAKKLVSR